MSNWPTFFIAGAPRAGTTSLHRYLRHHPDIYMPAHKEPHFFAQVEAGGDADGHFIGLLGNYRKEDQYLSLFADGAGMAVIGESTPSYLFDEKAPARIYEKIPNAKIILILREPIQRAYSHYKFFVAIGRESGRQDFFGSLIADYNRQRKIVGHSFLYVESGLYYEAVKRYLDTFGSSNVRIYLYDDLQSSTAGVVRDICEFLDVDYRDGSFFDPDRAYNSSRAPRSALLRRIWRSPRIRAFERWLYRHNITKILHKMRRERSGSGAKESTIDARATEFLRSKYESDVLKLQELIGRDLSGWLSEMKKG